MKTKLIVAVITCALFLLICVSSLFAFGPRDQFWTVDAAEYQITSVWKVNIETEFHFDDHFCLFKRQADIGFSRKMRKWLVIGINYRWADEKTNAEWELENRPHINASIFWKMGRLNLQDRTRMEYRIQKQSDPMWRYRNKLRVGLPLPGTTISLEPYMSDEIFVIFNRLKIDEHRVIAGVASRLQNHLKVELYGMIKSEREFLGWSNTKIMGANILLMY